MYIHIYLSIYICIYLYVSIPISISINISTCSHPSETYPCCAPLTYGRASNLIMAYLYVYAKLFLIL